MEIVGVPTPDILQISERRSRFFKQIEGSGQLEPIMLKKGEEMGFFQLGSTVIVLCENSNDAHWQVQTTKHNQPCKYGEVLAERAS